MLSQVKKTEKNQNRYGILGGSFDPIHNGHLFIAQTAMEELSLDKVIIIPNRVSPHKLDIKVTDGYHRLIMSEIAAIDNQNFCVSPMEIHRQGPSYTIDTIKQLMEENPVGTSYYFITGTDVILELDTWKNHEELLKIINFVVVTRAGYDYSTLEDKIQYLEKQYRSKVIKIKIPNLEISSTDIRKRVKEGRYIKYLVPDGVGKYIKKHGLYLD
ncbi:nicotinate-nucleotide adenylyltransferase [Alkaliphilus transvaalensis]|uniref:nicotinate-nucleotide adenylyltransferase n=1 Tax=Alkaliphilus transvaalensis TaxID=114628 RepID=UPI00047AD726|nr:nicotinate-nucleotide adenylyltransferase [Alkaliphilus transvaalensis]